MFNWPTVFLVSFLFFFSIALLDVFFRCDDHAPFYNLFNVTLKNLGMFDVNSFCHLHSFFAHCFYLIVEFFVLRKQKRNKLPTTTTTTTTSLPKITEIEKGMLCFVFFLWTNFLYSVAQRQASGCS